ncbi:hypothetical protein NCS56_00200800 [Fusarium sp. Ph1]|nr:hypothetical protein NCS56_00200800 [Fusarium sp. Ph1]
MFLSPLVPLLTCFLVATPRLAAKVWLFNSNNCVDPSGMKTCYDKALSAALECFGVKKCEEEEADGESECALACRCLQTQDEIDCALTHCWNQVYSCEYQQTVGELSNSCSRVDWEAILFYPAPFDAPAACSCNLGQPTVSLKRLIEEGKSCTDKIGDLAGHDPEDVIETCLCCQTSGLSINWNVCPDMNPSLIGADDWYNLVPLDNFPTCGKYMDDISCVGDLGFPPPGADKSAKFYAPGEFPKNGIETTISNLDGSVTSPLSGETFSWTLGAIEHTVIVASVDAKPTGSAGGEKADN